MYKQLSILTLTTILAACGGGSSSSDDKSDKSPVNNQYQSVLADCGGGTARDIRVGAEVFDNNQRYVLSPVDKAATIEVKDSGSTVCVSGAVAGAGVTGSGHTLYVNGDVARVIIQGDNQTVVVWGKVALLEAPGTNSTLYSESVASVPQLGDNTFMKKIDEWRQ